MNRMVVCFIVVLVLLLLAWLTMGRRVTLFVDRLIPARTARLAVSPIYYDGGFRIGDRDLTFCLTNNLRSNLRVCAECSSRVILLAGDDAMVLGQQIEPIYRNGRPEIYFTPDPGDELALTARESLVPWATPFEIRFFGPTPPRWHRYVYYRLVWKKRSGAQLEMAWRYERLWFKQRGWTEPLMMYNSQTGLLSTEIRAESKGMEGAIVRYIGRTKGWKRSEYSIESRGASQDGQSERFAVVHFCDVQAQAPGAGKSVELLVDRAKQQVTQELGGQ